MDNDTHHTSDIGEAAAILSVGGNLLGIEERSPHRFDFVFSDGERCRQCADHYWRSHLDVDAKTLTANLRHLKDMVFARRRNGDEDERRERTRPGPR